MCIRDSNIELPSISPGKHRLEIHIRLDRDTFSWGGSDPAILEITKQRASGEASGALITKLEYSNSIIEKLDPNQLERAARSSTNQPIALQGQSEISESRQSKGESGWFLLKLNPFVLEEETTLAFRWKATDSTLKCGICWDYMDVVQIGQYFFLICQGEGV